MAKLTQAGLVIDSLSTILERKQQKATSILSGLVPEGEVVPVDSSSVLGRILQISAETDYLQEEAIQELFASLSPNSATYRNLDKIVQLKDMKRKQSSMGTTSLILYGDINVTVGQSSIISSKVTGDQFSLDSEITFKNTAANGVEFETINLDVDGTIIINYTLSSDISSNAPITIKTIAGLTKEEAANFIKINIEGFSSKLKVEITNEFNIQIKPIQLGLLGDFYVSGNARIIRSFVPANATSLYEVGSQEPDSITTIQSPTYGWRGVTNPFTSIESRPIESDDQLRMRFFKGTGSLATGHLVAMYTALYDVDGVTYVSIKENTFGKDALDGRTSHGFAVIVYGGNDQDIAEAIEKTRPVGVPMNGNVTIPVNNYYNHTSNVKFSRPVQVAIKIKIGLDIFDDFPTTGVAEIKRSIIDYFNNMTFGEDLILSRLYIPIQSVNGVGVKTIQIAKVGEEYGSDNIEIAYNEVVTISYEDIEI